MKCFVSLMLIGGILIGELSAFIDNTRTVVYVTESVEEIEKLTKSDESNEEMSQKFAQFLVRDFLPATLKINQEAKRRRTDGPEVDLAQIAFTAMDGIQLIKEEINKTEEFMEEVKETIIEVEDYLGKIILGVKIFVGVMVFIIVTSIMWRILRMPAMIFPGAAAEAGAGEIFLLIMDDLLLVTIIICLLIIIYICFKILKRQALQGMIVGNSDRGEIKRRVEFFKDGNIKVSVFEENEVEDSSPCSSRRAPVVKKVRKAENRKSRK